MTAGTQMINGFDPASLDTLPAVERDMVSRRAKLLGEAYKLFYDRPIQFARGEGVWLYDADGKPYLDVYNNVPQVGHCHPKVIEAVTRQISTLNTHTRYLHDGILRYAEDLLATFDTGINRVMFTCSGSEAVDLALRVARYETGGTGLIITENAYHGLTTAVAAISPSLGPNVPLGKEVFTVPAPDSYRARVGEDIGDTFAANVAAVIAHMKRRDIRPAALVLDGVLSTDGVLTDPPGFLAKAVDVVHAAGGLYIADEVQGGFGRAGLGMWSFSRHGVTPDLVVMGKPMGNGLPIAAMAARAEVLEKFGRDIRYFNTFGGNTVSIAAAQAVLNVIRDEGLIENARVIGDYMADGIRDLSRRFPAIGDVRNAGLFIGADFVTDPDSKAPDGAKALRVVNALRRKQVLISASGKTGNVLKIRPPLPFNRENADLFLERLGEVLAEDQ